MTFSEDRKITADQFIDLLNRSTLGERRPVGDRARIEAMLKHSNLLCTAWDGEILVGAARSLTDFAYCCYLSDLAVDQAYQRQGIGVELIRRIALYALASSGVNLTLTSTCCPGAIS